MLCYVMLCYVMLCYVSLAFPWHSSHCQSTMWASLIVYHSSTQWKGEIKSTTRTSFALCLSSPKKSCGAADTFGVPRWILTSVYEQCPQSLLQSSRIKRLQEVLAALPWSWLQKPNMDHESLGLRNMSLIDFFFKYINNKHKSALLCCIL